MFFSNMWETESPVTHKPQNQQSPCPRILKRKDPDNYMRKWSVKKVRFLKMKVRGLEHAKL